MIGKSNSMAQPTATLSFLALGLVAAAGVMLISALGFWLLFGQRLAGGDFSKSTAALERQKQNLKVTYRSDFLAAMTDYLTAGSQTDDFLAGDFLKKTQAVRGQILAWPVAAEFKEPHLKTVLLLDQIERDLQAGQTVGVPAALSQLQAILLALPTL